ncbi:uncharacterized protein TNCV_2632631 [Trichonephila clavipes]|nr:uncharacterized protein TNCV_2632631 [Trichonephila clavipes]
MEIAERKRWAEDEGCRNGVRNSEKIELEGEGHFTRACLDIEVSTDRGNIGNEVRSIQPYHSGGRAEDGRRMNERIALEGEMRLKKERWLVEEQMRHIQEKRKTSMEEQKCLPEERCEQIQTRSADQYAVAQSVVVEKEKEEISVDVIKDKDDINPVILSKERIDFDEDEIEEEKPKLPKRKRKNLSSRTVAELQQKVNLKASSNMVLIPQNWSFRGEYSQDKSEMGKLAWKLMDLIIRDGTVKIRQSSRENRMIIYRQRFRFKLRTHNNIYQDGKVRGETRPLDLKIVDPAWVKKEVVRKLRKSEIDFQKRFKLRAKSKVTIGRDKASARFYWNRGKRSSRDIIITYPYSYYCCICIYGGAAIEERGKTEDESEQERRKGTRWRSDRTWQNEERTC